MFPLHEFLSSEFERFNPVAAGGDLCSFYRQVRFYCMNINHLSFHSMTDGHLKSVSSFWLLQIMVFCVLFLYAFLGGGGYALLLERCISRTAESERTGHRQTRSRAVCQLLISCGHIPNNTWYSQSA